MKIVDLTQEHEQLYFWCLEDWSDEMKEAGNHKALWFDKMKDKGLGVKLALDDDGTVGGMIQNQPIEQSFIEGEDLYFINCIWVHGYDNKSRPNFQKLGMGKALIEAAEEDAKSKGAKGIAAWGISHPFWMQASWFEKQGYKPVDTEDAQVLLWKSFSDEAQPPKWIRPKKKPERVAGKVVVTAFKNGWCSAYNILFERAKRAATDLGDKVIFNEIDTLDIETFTQWGISDAIYISENNIGFGPPPSYEELQELISKEIQKLQN